MIHIYCGDGKGKTTAGMGLCLRAAGAGKQVLIYQFLKDNTSSERKLLEHIPGICVMKGPERIKFLFQMTPEEKEAMKREYMELLDNLSFHRSALDIRRADLQLLVVMQCNDLVKGDGGVFGRIQLFDEQNVAALHLVLLAAGFDNCVHYVGTSLFCILANLKL